MAETLGSESRRKSTPVAGIWKPETAKAEHEARIATTIDAIRRGDIYQANITQRFLAEMPRNVASYDLYLGLRSAAAGPFAAFINAGGQVEVTGTGLRSGR